MLSLDDYPRAYVYRQVVRATNKKLLLDTIERFTGAATQASRKIAE